MSFENMPVIGGMGEKSMFYFEWKIPNCLAFIHETTGWCVSPSIESFNRTWTINICAMVNQICIRLLVNERGMIKRYSYKLSILKADKTEYTSVQGRRFVSSRKICMSSEFINVTETDLLSNDVAPDGVLTVCCTITYNHGAEESEEVKGPSETKRELADTKRKDSETSEKEDGSEQDDMYFLGLEKLSQDFTDLLINGEDSDVTMKVKDQEFKVHKAILQARSPVFAAMFRNVVTKKKNQVVHISDSNPDAFHRFLLYLYSGDVEKIHPDETFNLYRLANKYDIKLLKEQCAHFTIRRLTVDNFCDFMASALLHEESELVEKAADFFSKNVREIIATIQWLAFQKQHPVEANELHIKAWNFISLK